MAKKIIICGSTGCGKTTLSLKIAKMIEKKLKAEVIVVFAEDKGSPLNYALRIGEDKGDSLGQIIITPDSTTDQVGQAIAFPRGESNIGVMGYHIGETVHSYPRMNDKQVRQFFYNLDALADYIIIDGTAEYENNLITWVGLDQSDKVILMCGGDPKSFTYVKSVLNPIMQRSRRGISMVVLNDTKAFSAVSVIAEQLGGVDYQLPYDVKLLEQSLEGRMLSDVSINSHKKDFNYWLENMVDVLLMEKNTDEAIQIKEERKAGSGRLFNSLNSLLKK